MPAPSPEHRTPEPGWGGQTARPPPGGGAPRAAGIRAKQGVHVATDAEREIADFLWDNGIPFGYDQDLAGLRATFTIPDKHVVIETGEDRERDEALRGRGFHAIVVRPGRVKESLKERLMSKFPGKAWR